MRISDWSSDGCSSDLILGFQSYPQLEATYGIQDAAAITGYCSTWVALRANDTPTAKHVSENLGQVEQVERSEEHTSELQSLMRISYAVFCLKKKKSKRIHT